MYSTSFPACGKHQQKGAFCGWEAFALLSSSRYGFQTGGYYRRCVSCQSCCPELVTHVVVSCFSSQILIPQIEPLTEQQVVGICNLQQSSQQAEDALSQGMEALQQSLADTLATGSLGSPNVANYMGQMAMAMGKLSTLESFVRQVRFRHSRSHPFSSHSSIVQFIFWNPGHKTNECPRRLITFASRLCNKCTGF